MQAELLFRDARSEQMLDYLREPPGRALSLNTNSKAAMRVQLT